MSVRRLSYDVYADRRAICTTAAIQCVPRPPYSYLFVVNHVALRCAEHTLAGLWLLRFAVEAMPVAA